jgi:hypothetical protein
MIESYSRLILTTDFDENAWGFGQLVAIILISLPFLTALEEYKGWFLRGFEGHLANSYRSRQRG